MNVLYSQLKLIQPILDLIESREELLQSKHKLDTESSDPKRLLSKKTASTVLLQQEKDRKRLLTSISKVESKLITELQAWQQTQGKPFLYQGRKYFFELLEIQKTKKIGSLNKSSVASPKTPKIPNSPFSPTNNAFATSLLSKQLNF